ncbi:hypothetical protein LTR37_016811 [Vermiconidia calcicola]|uniref:Uncharacterized protein n=1 Tax=Vermiconidia calcicola TaxID=1690605 RepID=A0ACC3MLR0_9PEZI|nr:hypothetical protein LTR37_016811 [Vermiconidia calcicola]
MAAYDIQKHFKGLRVDTGRRRRSRDPFAETFDDDSDDDKNRRSRSKTKQASTAEKESPAVVAPAKTSISSPSTAVDALRDNNDASLEPPKRTDRRPSPAPPKLPALRVTDGAGRRGSLDKGLQHKISQTRKNPRSAVAQAAGTLAYLDDSDDDEPERERAPRSDRYPSPAPRKYSDPVDPLQRSSTPKGTREPVKEPPQPSRHTVASPFAGTKYLDDSESDGDSEEEAVSSRKSSVDEAIITDTRTESPEKQGRDVRRVDKPKQQNGGGVSWRAFSAGRAEQRNTELEAIQTSLKQRGKSISFGSHAVTDDGNKVPIAPTSDQIFGGSRGRRTGRGSPPRRAEDTKPTDDEMADAGSVGVYDPTQFKTNPFTGKSSEENPSDALAAIQTQVGMHTNPETTNGPPASQVVSPISGSTMSPTSDRSASPIDTGGLENSTGSLTSRMTISPPRTIPEGIPIDYTVSPILSPTEEMNNPLSRNSSARSIRMSGSRPTRIPNAGARRQSRRSTSANPSPSPAHAFLSSWSKDAAASEPAPEPKQDDEGQAIGLNNEYIIGRLINQGGFGVVKEVHTRTQAGENIIRAVKIVRKAIPEKDETENEKAQQELEHEVSVWRHLKHRHILDLHAVYETDFATFCVMDLNVGGTLFDVVRTSRGYSADNAGRKGLDPKLAKSYAFQLACALRYLHEDIRVCHRDVKLENCLIDMSGPNAESEGGNLRLCDFGLADFLHSGNTVDDASPDRFREHLLTMRSTAQYPTTSSVIGTLEYASPKGLSVNRKLFECAGDVWAFGVIVYALCTGELPFRHQMPSKTVELILQADWDESAILNAATGGSEVKDLVQGCLERDIDLRLHIGEVLRSGWFEGCKEALGEDEGSEMWR